MRAPGCPAGAEPHWGRLITLLIDRSTPACAQGDRWLPLRPPKRLAPMAAAPSQQQQSGAPPPQQQLYPPPPPFFRLYRPGAELLPPLPPPPPVGEYQSFGIADSVCCSSAPSLSQLATPDKLACMRGAAGCALARCGLAHQQRLGPLHVSS